VNISSALNQLLVDRSISNWSARLHNETMTSTMALCARFVFNASVHVRFPTAVIPEVLLVGTKQPW
jgi:hypothetical protein